MQQGRAFADYTQRLGRNYNLFSGAQFGGDLATRLSASLGWAGDGRRRPNVMAGVISAAGDLGFRVAASSELITGVLLRVDWQNDPLPFDHLGRRNRQLVIEANADLAMSGRRLVTRGRGARPDLGAISGSVAVEGPRGDLDLRLGGLSVRVDGQVRALTQGDGRFFVGNLPDGVYRIELDPEHLPLELTMVKSVAVARISSAAVTQVQFVVRPEFGIAGRLADDRGRMLAGVPVELIDETDEVVAAAVTDQFGLYRMDGISPGDYLLRVASQHAPGGRLPTASRPVHIREAFLFGQDLLLRSVL